MPRRCRHHACPTRTWSGWSKSFGGGSSSTVRGYAWRAPGQDASLGGCCVADASLARLRYLAVVHLRVDADVVERAREDRQGDRARLGAARVVVREVVTLPGGQRAEGEPDDEKKRTYAHRDLRRDGARVLPRVSARRTRLDPVEDHVPERAAQVDGVDLTGIRLTEPGQVPAEGRHLGAGVSTRTRPAQDPRLTTRVVGEDIQSVREGVARAVVGEA